MSKWRNNLIQWIIICVWFFSLFLRISCGYAVYIEIFGDWCDKTTHISNSELFISRDKTSELEIDFHFNRCDAALTSHVWDDCDNRIKHSTTSSVALWCCVLLWRRFESSTSLLRPSTPLLQFHSSMSTSFDNRRRSNREGERYKHCLCRGTTTSGKNHKFLALVVCCSSHQRVLFNIYSITHINFSWYLLWAEQQQHSRPKTAFS